MPRNRKPSPHQHALQKIRPAQTAITVANDSGLATSSANNDSVVIEGFDNPVLVDLIPIRFAVACWLDLLRSRARRLALFGESVNDEIACAESPFDHITPPPAATAGLVVSKIIAGKRQNNTATPRDGRKRNLLFVVFSFSIP